MPTVKNYTKRKMTELIECTQEVTIIAVACCRDGNRAWKVSHRLKIWNHNGSFRRRAKVRYAADSASVRIKPVGTSRHDCDGTLGVYEFQQRDGAPHWKSKDIVVEFCILPCAGEESVNFGVDIEVELLNGHEGVLLNPDLNGKIALEFSIGDLA